MLRRERPGDPVAFPPPPPEAMEQLRVLFPPVPAGLGQSEAGPGADLHRSSSRLPSEHDR
jgi:hypothetical protein